jgi:predicted neutral ceramidase superfamily lipid hydrolase
MKFLIKKDIEYSRLFKSLIVSVISTLFIYLLLDIALHYFVIGIDISSISNTLYGNEAHFTEAILLDSLLLQVHIDLFMNIITLMILSSVYIRYFSNNPSTKVLIHILLLSGILAPISLLIAYFSSVIFIYLWLVCFALAHIIALFMSLAIIKRLLSK